jgi:hypothetical protein
MSFRGILSKKQAHDLMSEAAQYARKVPVKAVQVMKKFSVETRTGDVETGYPGDYLLQDILHPDDFWIVRREIFEAEFELVESSRKIR